MSPQQFILFMLTSFTSSINCNCWDGSLYSTKTPYKLLGKDELEKRQQPSGRCEPIQINMVHRHGNRYPSSKDVRKMKAMSTKINKAIKTISLEVPLELPWRCPFTEAQNKLLSSVGEKELYHIGKNIQFRFPGLVTEPYSPLRYKFQSTCKLRCTHSSSALAAGIFEHMGNIGDYKFQPIAINTSACDNDSILRFFENCEKYVVNVEENKSSLVEQKKFQGGKEVEKVLEKVVLKLGTNETKLNADDLKAIFIACAYDIGMFNGTSGICSLFDDDDRSVMEYTLDLKHFYKRSAGFDKITYESSCPLLRDIIDTLKDAVTNPSESYIGVFRSGHAETLLPLYALMGLYLDDEHITAANYQEMKRRKFRPGCMSPFSGNMYFVLYDCGDDFKIQLYVNERLAKMPCCNSKVDCNFKAFLKFYEKYTDQCNFDEMCKLNHEEL